ncbi:hypothetical protein LEMLEM_LOCUS19574, partial [Lemmus lemmus]
MKCFLALWGLIHAGEKFVLTASDTGWGGSIQASNLPPSRPRTTADHSSILCEFWIRHSQ